MQFTLALVFVTDAVRRVAEGGSVLDPDVVARLVGRKRTAGPLDSLTPRERQVLALIAEGRSNAGIPGGSRLQRAGRRERSARSGLTGRLPKLPPLPSQYAPAGRCAAMPLGPASAHPVPVGHRGSGQGFTRARTARRSATMKGVGTSASCPAPPMPGPQDEGMGHDGRRTAGKQ
jgi:hypothetical protein